MNLRHSIYLLAALLVGCGTTDLASSDPDVGEAVADVGVLGPDAGAGPDAGPPPLCANAKPTCFGLPDYVLECSESGGWQARRCEAGKLCHQGACQQLACVPDSKECKDGEVRSCTSDGQGWRVPVPCGPGLVCSGGTCVPSVCNPDAVRCSPAGVPERCNASGSAWETGTACTGGTTCVDGTCLGAGCTPGARECGLNTLYTCDAAGKWIASACPGGQPCVYGRCVSCVSRENCKEWETCLDGACTPTVPKIVTVALPSAAAEAAYSFKLQAEGGKLPYQWSLAGGTLPTGMSLLPDGTIAGTPGATPGSKSITVKVVDGLQASDQRQFVLDVAPKGKLTITTRTLPEGEMGEPYSATLAASGGQSPYAWLLAGGALPRGVEVGPGGKLVGAPEEHGTFQMTFRVVDSLTPPGYADQALSMLVKIAPLQITGDKTYNLLVTKLVALPTLVQLVPYSTKLTAKGGVKPYTWTETTPPSSLSWLTTKWGLPQGLTLKADGTLSGWVTSASDATQIKIPFTAINLTGYFTYVELTDQQNPAAKDAAIVCLPTIPLTN